MKTKISLVLLALMVSLSAYGSFKAFDSSGLDLGHFADLECSTGATCTNVSGKMRIVVDPSTVTGDMTLQSGEVLSNSVDDTVSFASNDAVTTLSVIGFEAKDAILLLSADQSDDNADDWQIESDQATNQLIISNDNSGSQAARLSIDADDGDLILVGGLIGDGSRPLVGFDQSQIASSTTTLTIAQCGATVVSNSADVMTLPEASTAQGCRYTFVCGTADDFDVNPSDATDSFGITGSITGANTTTVLAPSAGDALRCTDIGAGFIIEAVGADLWAVLSTNGIITDVN